jgi:phosphonate transport system ATP-binding protein
MSVPEGMSTPSDLDLLCQFDRVVDLYTEVTNLALDLGVTEQQLDSSGRGQPVDCHGTFTAALRDCHMRVIAGRLQLRSGTVTDHAIVLKRVCKSFERGKPVLRSVSLEIAPGEMVALIGASGSGKSTLLRQISGLTLADNPDSFVSVFGQNMQQGGRKTARLRSLRREIGFIFQQFNLVDRLPVLTNVLIGRLGQMPHLRRWIGWFTAAEIRDAMASLVRVGISDRAGQRAGTLSGGQQQRAAIARALMQRARIILADEPIASLDPRSASRVMDALSDINRCDGVTVVVSLHQVEFARRYCHRIVALNAGKIVFDGPPVGLDDRLLAEVYGAEAEDAGVAAVGPVRADRDLVPVGDGAVH